MGATPDDSLTALGRFSEPALHVLIALAEGPQHGYAIMMDIEAMTGSRPGPGTLYGAIARLEQRGWIEPLPSVDRRRPYQLTPAGRTVLQVRVDTLHVIARVARQRLANA